MVCWCFLKVRCRGGRVISSGPLNPFAIAFTFLIQFLYPFNLLSSFFFSLTTFFLLSKLRSCSGLQLTIKQLKVLRITVLNCPTPPQHSWVRSCSSEMFLAYSSSFQADLCGGCGQCICWGGILFDIVTHSGTARLERVSVSRPGWGSHRVFTQCHILGALRNNCFWEHPFMTSVRTWKSSEYCSRREKWRKIEGIILVYWLSEEE